MPIPLALLLIWCLGLTWLVTVVLIRTEPSEARAELAIDAGLPLRGRWWRYLRLAPLWMLLAFLGTSVFINPHFCGSPGVDSARRIAALSAAKALRVRASTRGAPGGSSSSAATPSPRTRFGAGTIGSPRP